VEVHGTWRRLNHGLTTSWHALHMEEHGSALIKVCCNALRMLSSKRLPKRRFPTNTVWIPVLIFFITTFPTYFSDHLHHRKFDHIRYFPPRLSPILSGASKTQPPTTSHHQASPTPLSSHDSRSIGSHPSASAIFSTPASTK
jgi:hypothetical protein